MADFTLVEPRGWEYDLHSVYSAFIGYFQTYNIPWYERSWGHLFESFDRFLSFSWPVITVTDSSTGRAHIVTRLNSISAFLKMIKTRFGETLPQPPNLLQVDPFETVNRHLRHVPDYSTYKKIHSTLPAAILSALKARVKAGDPKAIKQIWEKRDKTFMAISFQWNERNEKTVLEFGYAAVRCGHLEALAHWPPNPDTNYRKGHYIVAEYIDKFNNKYSPTYYPWQYAFGDTQVAPKAKLPQIVQAVISSLASPESETAPNALVLIGHNVQGDLARLEEMRIKLPHNMLIIDTMVFERSLYTNGYRGAIMLDPKGDKSRSPNSNLSLEQILYTFTIPLTPTSAILGSTSPRQVPVAIPNCTLQNAGNHAWMCLFALQKLLEPASSSAPIIKKFNTVMPNGMPMSMPFAMQMPMQLLVPPTMNRPGLRLNATPPGMQASLQIQRPASSYDLSTEFGQMSVEQRRRLGDSTPNLLNPGRPNEKGSKRVNSFPGIGSSQTAKGVES